MTFIPATTPAAVLPRRRQLLFGTAFAAVAVSIYEFALIGMYLSERAANRSVWLKENAIPLTQPNMQLLTLIMGSVFVQWAAWAIARNERGQSFLALGLTTLMGVAFLNQTTFLWSQVGMTAAQAEGPLFYAITVSHFVFVIGALVFIAVSTFRALGGQYSSRYPEGISAAAMFWHVTVALYAVLWLAVYIMK
jgi:heme/copper-type cytochrome/quinol oxidase subunit 3